MEKESEESKKRIKKKKEEIKEEIEIPVDVDASLDSFLHIKGPKGELSRAFNPIIKIEIKDKKIIVSAKQSRKKEKKNLYTIKGHIKNMILGVREGFIYRLQICFVHFPMAVSIEKERNLLVIKNFLGETKERTAEILPGVNVKIEKDIVTVESCDKEKAGQTAANIETTTRIKARDRRIFQDGIFIISKAGKDIAE